MHPELRRPVPRPPRLYPLADVEALAPAPVSRGVAWMLEAGARWIQVRAKRLPDDLLYAEMEQCCRLVEGTGAELWIDDRVDLATLFPVAGVHLGQTDLPAAAARRVVGPRVWIGMSTHDEAQLRSAECDPEVDCVAFGPVYPTTGKETADPTVGIAGLRRARALTGKPLIAIGGIDGRRLAEVLGAGADSAAVLGAACRGDVVRETRRMLETVQALEAMESAG